jgi:hypothetical protein
MCLNRSSCWILHFYSPVTKLYSIEYKYDNQVTFFFSYSNTVVAESALDRLTCGLGGKTMMPHVEQNIPGMLSNPDWRYRYGTYKINVCALLSHRSHIYFTFMCLAAK